MTDPTTARDRAIELIYETLAWERERGAPIEEHADVVVDVLLARREVLRELLNESKGEHAEGLAGEELPFLVRAQIGEAVRAIVDRWHAAGSPTDPEVLRALAGVPTADVAEDRRALDSIAELCGARAGDHRDNVVMVVRSMLQDPAVHNARRARALAVVGRLVNALQNLIEDSSDPGAEALGAVWEGRSFLGQGGGVVPAGGPTVDVAGVVEAARGYLAATEGYAVTFRQGQWRARLAEAVAAAPEGVAAADEPRRTLGASVTSPDGVKFWPGTYRQTPREVPTDKLASPECDHPPRVGGACLPCAVAFYEQLADEQAANQRARREASDALDCCHECAATGRAVLAALDVDTTEEKR